MKLQPASKKEIRRMAIGCLLCGLLECLLFGILHLVEIAIFSYRIVLSIGIGTAIAVLNFSLMCIMVQKAAAASDEGVRKASIRFSYNLRLFIQAIWIVVALLCPVFNVIAAALPLLFPTFIIYYLQLRGRLFADESTTSVISDNKTEEDNDIDHLNTFEV